VTPALSEAPYETTDLGVVAFVLYQGHQPSQLRQDSRHMTVFVFGPEARAEVARYYARESVEAFRFVTCMNNARAMMRTLWPSREPIQSGRRLPSATP
jgi:hypothetical protein